MTDTDTDTGVRVLMTSLIFVMISVRVQVGGPNIHQISMKAHVQQTYIRQTYSEVSMKSLMLVGLRSVY